jgi:hypothetical protein
MEQVYPLQWPEGMPRTPRHRIADSRFDVSPDRAQRLMHDEIKRMGGRNIIVSTNQRVRRDGGVYAADLNRTPDDAGVAVFFDRDGQRVCFACDRYPRLWENMRAIGKTIEAMRAIERYGSQELLNRAFTGFAALPSPEQASHWRSVLGVKEGRSPGLEALTDRYRELAKRRHPDSGGSAEQFQALQEAFEQAKKELGYA